MPGDRTVYPIRGSLRREVVILYHRITLGAAGAIASQDAAKVSGITAVKTGSEVGRYTLTLHARYAKLLGAKVTIIGDTDAAYTSTAGREFFLRNDNTTAAAKTLDIQLARTDTGADAEAINSAVLLVELVLAASV